MTSTSTNKFKHVVVSGCSLTAGTELVDLDARWSRTLASLLDNAVLWNYSKGGISNELVSQNLINALIANQSECTPDNTLVVVQWTYSSRLNFMGKKDRYYTLAHYNMTPSIRKQKILRGHNNVYFNDDFEDFYDLEYYYQYHNNPLFLIYNTTKIIHHTQCFLKLKGYRYVFIFCDSTEKKLLDLKRNIINPKMAFEKDIIPPFYHTAGDIDKSAIFPVAITDFAHANKYPVGPDTHPLEKSNIEYGKLLYKYVKEKFNV